MQPPTPTLKNALIALSGGLDSSTLLYEYAPQIALAVSFSYGSKHNDKEIACAKAITEELGIEHVVIPLNFIGDYFRSSLLQSSAEAIPLEEYNGANIQSTVVPFRNGIMLSVLAGLAESRQLEQILIANHFGDHAVYPDCSAAFIHPMTQAVEAGTTNRVRLVAPYTSLNKWDIVARGTALGVPFAKTYSCYQGGELHCGECATCRERKQAFSVAGVPDPTPYLN